MLIILILLLAALPGRALAKDNTFKASDYITGLVNGKAVCGKEISFAPEAMFNDEMMDLFGEGND